ncbi:MAG: EAL domain-containing protein [Thiotrichales bacterium]|nr:EAL domain-containing protein [Thiotrichales bacterium]
MIGRLLFLPARFWRKSFFWLLLLTTVSLSIWAHTEYQAQQQKQIFIKQAQQLQQNLLLEEQKLRSLAATMAQYYALKPTQSMHEQTAFAHAVLTNTSYVQAILLAEPQARKPSAETITGLFLKQAADPALRQRDLLTIEPLKSQLDSLIRENRALIFWLDPIGVEPRRALLWQPIYHQNPAPLSEAQRQSTFAGAIVLIIDANSAIASQIDRVFGSRSVSATFIANSITDTRQTDASQAWQAMVQQPSLSPTWKTFSTRITPTADWGACQLELQQTLSWQAIAIPKAALSGLFALLGFILVFGVGLSIVNKTQRLAEMNQRLQELLTFSQDAIVITDQCGLIKVWNPRAESLLGWTAEQACGQFLPHLIFPDDCTTQAAECAPLLRLFELGQQEMSQRGQAAKIELPLKTQRGKHLDAEIAYSVLGSAQSQEVSLFIQDVTQQRQSEKEIRHIAFYDALTGLENRLYFSRQLQQQLSHRREEPFALLFLDLDGFKQVNDSLGHGLGDELLQVVSKRLTHNLKGVGDLTHIARFGGDEFVLLLRQITNAHLQPIVQRILHNIERSIHLQGHELRVSASIGVAFYPEDGHDVDTLLRQADTAMYEAKARGKNTYALYHHHMSQQVAARLQMEKHLRNALINKEFYLCYQPKIELKSGQVIGVEALLRWRNPQLGQIPPNVFIPIAEETRLILPISQWVIEQSLLQLHAWHNTPYAHLTIAINISSSQFAAPDFVETLQAALQQADLPTKQLQIELTESTVMTNADSNIQRLNALREAGFDLAVDDFGTGYSSLSYLKRFPISILKIDKSFIDGLPLDEEDASISHALIQLAHNLKIQVVAEGIETPAQLAFLQAAGCEYGQGYLISRPLTQAKLMEWLPEHANHFYQSAYYLALNETTPCD